MVRKKWRRLQINFDDNLTIVTSKNKCDTSLKPQFNGKCNARKFISNKKL